MADSGMSVVGFFDDFSSAPKSGIPILGGTESVAAHFAQGTFDALMVGIGYNHMGFRAEMFDRFKEQIPFANVIHSSAFIEKSVKLGTGVFILPHCTVDAHAQLGNNVLLNTATTVAHHTTVGHHCFFAPCVAVAGKTRIGQRVVLGINSTVIDHLEICDDARTGAGAVVTESISQPGLYLGIPARRHAN
jgi:sugar O-acyltransferase (sialic acid O-acetyltransferase NeuD family)